MPPEWASATGLRNLLTLDLADNPLTGALLVPIHGIEDDLFVPVSWVITWYLGFTPDCAVCNKADAMDWLVTDITG